MFQSSSFSAAPLLQPIPKPLRVLSSEVPSSTNMPWFTLVPYRFIAISAVNTLVLRPITFAQDEEEIQGPSRDSTYVHKDEYHIISKLRFPQYETFAEDVAHKPNKVDIKPEAYFKTAAFIMKLLENERTVYVRRLCDSIHTYNPRTFSEVYVKKNTNGNAAPHFVNIGLELIRSGIMHYFNDGTSGEIAVYEQALKQAAEEEALGNPFQSRHLTLAQELLALVKKFDKKFTTDIRIIKSEISMGRFQMYYYDKDSNEHIIFASSLFGLQFSGITRIAQPMDNSRKFITFKNAKNTGKLIHKLDDDEIQQLYEQDEIQTNHRCKWSNIMYDTAVQSKNLIKEHVNSSNLVKVQLVNVVQNADKSFSIACNIVSDNGLNIGTELLGKGLAMLVDSYFAVASSSSSGEQGVMVEKQSITQEKLFYDSNCNNNSSTSIQDEYLAAAQQALQEHKGKWTQVTTALPRAEVDQDNDESNGNNKKQRVIIIDDSNLWNAGATLNGKMLNMKNENSKYQFSQYVRDNAWRINYSNLLQVVGYDKELDPQPRMVSTCACPAAEKAGIKVTKASKKQKKQPAMEETSASSIICSWLQDAMQDLDKQVHEIVLFSGDKEYSSGMRLLNKQGFSTTVVAFDSTTCSAMKCSYNSTYVCLDNYIDYIGYH